MNTGCVAEVDMFMAYRQELPAERSAPILRHIAGCSLCHDLWKRFEVDDQVSRGIQSAIRGDLRGADAGPGWGLEDELPERLSIPGFSIRPGYIEGGQARVYRATYEASQEEVAIKVFHQSPLNEGGNERFAREIKSLARLRHPNVITIRSDGKVGGHAYFVMPWIEGLTLDEYVRGSALSPRRKVQLLCRICDAVDHAHRRGVLHLDLKPSNVRVDVGGEPIVMDFGLARLTGIDYAEPRGLPPGVAGTPLYMAPEQIANREDLDLRADVYALGLLLYEVLAGRRAKGADLDPGALPSVDVVREAPPSLRQVNPKVPKELEAITMRAIDPDRERRYQTARALHDDLQHYLGGRLVAALAHRPAYRMRKWLHVQRARIASLGLIAFVLVLGVALRVYLVRDAERMLEQRDRLLKEAIEELARLQVNQTRRELLEALEASEFLAARAGEWDLAERIARRAEDVRHALSGRSEENEEPGR